MRVDLDGTASKAAAMRFFSDNAAAAGPEAMAAIPPPTGSMPLMTATRGAPWDSDPAEVGALAAAIRAL
jgi:hypothetical protein